MQGRSGHRTTRLGRGTALRRLCCWLAVLPFLLFSLIQPGTMFVRDAQGSVAVVLCSGEGPVQMAVAADGSLVPADEMPHGDPHACDWAPHGQPALQGVVADAPQPMAAAARLALWPAPPAPPHASALPEPSARGPPRLI
ncbi:hypothetical protein EQ718_25825 (plasmid) [Paracoccus versutus]|uniref:DUF2946 domain-containing protein n=1 Tax=Paracoccus versutus TaxID=34007 RepID=A0AAQ0KMK4_PARVE|nr:MULTISPECIES: DUF2946 family protein [Paracoccus]WGR63563.1 hypothetical protein E3U26_23190 [Paracoccus ferrooxidans]KGJ11011.1 hypothetical protein IT40_09295 [Paracoccus versutus]MBT0781957.1 hypothetical protein [Paracoccus sp. pheM1]REG47025.1 hypothetical protein ATH84_101244 [Paracoccus versutus]WEJ82203.1 hypothetical protein EQ718_25825 [Paracoccus versutus]